MAIQTFYYYPSVFGDAFPGVTALLTGSWDAQGSYSDQWSEIPMQKVPAKDGGNHYEAKVALDDSQAGKAFHWGVWFEQDGQKTWAIASEVDALDSRDRHRSFVFDGNPSAHGYYLTHCRYLGALKYRKADGHWATQFRVWAPNAQKVELVFGALWDLEDPDKKPLASNHSLDRERLGGGYIYENGEGIHPDLPILLMIPQEDGTWLSPPDHPALQDLSYLNQRLYMYRITRDDGSQLFRTDLYSRVQIGHGAIDPALDPYSGALAELSGGVSCSVSLDLERVTRDFEVPVWPIPEADFIDKDEFWADEFSDRPLPKRVEDLIIYELHLGALGPDHEGPGTLKEALEMLDHIEALHVNAIELLPISEFSGDAFNWGYATSHYFAIEYSGGGRDQFKHFVKACHQRGIAVILDMVYNHYDHHASRAQRFFDSPDPAKDIYYWYEGQAENYPGTRLGASHLPNPDFPNSDNLRPGPRTNSKYLWPDRGS
ncbi:MAG: alpha-amylase family glycosyl hydrolase, partial [Bacteroidota bacterium]